MFSIKIDSSHSPVSEFFPDLPTGVNDGHAAPVPVEDEEAEQADNEADSETDSSSGEDE